MVTTYNSRSVSSRKMAESQQEQPDLSKFNWLHPSLPLPSCDRLENPQLRSVSSSESQQPSSHWREQTSLELPPKVSPGRGRIVTIWSVWLLQPHSQDLSLFDWTQNLLCVNSLSPGCLSKTISGNHLTSQLPEMGTQVRICKRLIQETLKKKHGNKMSTKH